MTLIIRSILYILGCVIAENCDHESDCVLTKCDPGFSLDCDHIHHPDRKLCTCLPDGIPNFTYEPQRRKRTFGHVRPAKIPINLCDRRDWSEFSLGAFGIDKNTKFFFFMRPTKTQISLRIRAVWSEFSLGANLGRYIFVHFRTLRVIFFVSTSLYGFILDCQTSERFIYLPW